MPDEWETRLQAAVERQHSQLPDIAWVVRRGRRIRRRRHAAAGVTILLIGVIAMIGLVARPWDVSSTPPATDGQLDKSLVPSGEVDRYTGLWRGTAETSAEGRRVKVELLVRRSKSSDEAFTATLMNIGEQPIGFGYGFSVHRKVDGEWKRMPMPNGYGYILPEFIIRPGQKSKPEHIVWAMNPGDDASDPVASGEYRVTKQVQPASLKPWRAGRRPPPFYVSARFVVRSDEGCSSELILRRRRLLPTSSCATRSPSQWSSTARLAIEPGRPRRFR